MSMSNKNMPNESQNMTILALSLMKSSNRLHCTVEFMIYLDVIILFHVSPFHSKHSSLCIKIYTGYSKRKRGTDTIAAGCSRGRLQIDFPKT